MICYVRRDCTNIFVDLSLITDVFVVELCYFKEFVIQMKLIVVVIITERDLFNFGFVDLLRVSGTKLNNHRGFLRNRSVHSSSIDINYGTSINRSA